MPSVAMLMAFMAGRVHEVAQTAARAVFVSSDPDVDAVVLQMQVGVACVFHGTNPAATRRGGGAYTESCAWYFRFVVLL